MKEKKVLIISAMALFSMFFGSGNLIFPPYLGVMTGDKWILGALGFLITGVGIVMLGVVAATRAGGTIFSMAKPLGNGFATVFATIVILTIGPGFAIPRTAATTYELLQGSLIPGLPSAVGTVVFFIVVLFFVLTPGSVIDRLGAILTPVLIVSMVIIIAKAVISPVGPQGTAKLENVFVNSFLEGYQTMDAIASLVFTSVIINSFRNKGFEGKKLLSLTIKAAFLAGIGLALIYGGLIYMGSTIQGANLQSMGRVELLIYGVKALLGQFGITCLAVAMAMACLTTAVGLTQTVGEYFNEMSNDKISFRNVVLISTVFSGFIAVIGVEKLIKISVPVLVWIYPVAIALIAVNLLPKKYVNKPVMVGAVMGALIPFVVSIVGLISGNAALWDDIAKSIAGGFGAFLWMVPAVVLALVFGLLSKKEN